MYFFCNFVQINLLKLFLLVAVFVVIIVVNAIYYISIKAVYNLAFWYEPSENAAFSLTQTLLSFFSSAHVKYGGSYVFAWSFCRFAVFILFCFRSVFFRSMLSNTEQSQNDYKDTASEKNTNESYMNYLGSYW